MYPLTVTVLLHAVANMVTTLITCSFVSRPHPAFRHLQHSFVLQTTKKQGMGLGTRLHYMITCLCCTAFLQENGCHLPRFCKILQEIGCHLPRFCKILQESLARILHCFLARHKLSTSKILLESCTTFLQEIGCRLPRFCKILQDLARYCKYLTLLSCKTVYF